MSPYIRWTRLLSLANDEAVNDNFDGVLFLFIQVDLIAQIVNLAIDAHTYIAGTAHLLKDIFILTLTPLNEWGKQENARPLRQTKDRIDDLLDGLPADLAPTYRTMGMTNTSIEQAQIVIDLGNCANSRARVMGCTFLVDRDSRREAIDMIDIRLLHLIQKLAGIGRERFDIATLALGKNGIKSQAALA